jgi:hypothetical protein
MTWPWTNLKKLLTKRLENYELSGKSYINIDELLEDIKNRDPWPWYKRVYMNIMWTLNDWSWYLYRLWKPCHNDVRKSIPRHWIGYDDLILRINFAMFIEYYTKSYLAYEEDKLAFNEEFSKWVEDTINYISVRRDRMLKKIEDTYPTEAELQDDTIRRELYGRVSQLEKELYDKDSQYISDIIKYREQLWG